MLVLVVMVADPGLSRVRERELEPECVLDSFRPPDTQSYLTYPQLTWTLLHRNMKKQGRMPYCLPQRTTTEPQWNKSHGTSVRRAV